MFCLSTGSYLHAEEGELAHKQPQTKADMAAVFHQNNQRYMRWLDDYFAELPEAAYQFDFLIGEWNTELVAYNLDGEVVNTVPGTWQAEKINGGRMIVDRYESTLPNSAVLSGGTTLRTFSPETQQWEMVFLTPMQANIAHQFVATFNAGEIHGRAYGKDLDGIETWSKIRFFNIQATRFAWELEMSWDDGKTWFKTRTIQAERP